jgi:activator of 2-hydroxyglutaryl-CoA dehydratase
LKTAGIDMGSGTVKVVIVDDEKVVSRRLVPTGFEPENAAKQAFEKALAGAGVQRDDLGGVIATGAGMKTAPYAGGTISMMGADARAGVHFSLRGFPLTRE